LRGAAIATHTSLGGVRGEDEAVGELEAVEEHRDGAIGVAADEQAGTGALDDVAEIAPGSCTVVADHPKLK
jgi:hypothetical protein